MSFEKSLLREILFGGGWLSNIYIFLSFVLTCLIGSWLGFFTDENLFPFLLCLARLLRSFDQRTQVLLIAG